mgnify:CR=1 FL=1
MPRFEFSRSVGRLALRPGVAAVVFFAPYVLAGPEASVTFDGGHLSLEAQGNVTIVAHDGDVVIQGGPNVKINCD